jgi:hypothetical protein
MDTANNLNALIDHYWNEFKVADPSRVFGYSKDVRLFRKELRTKHRPLTLIQDIADAHKHCTLNRQSRMLTSHQQTSPRSMGWGEAEYGIAEWNESHAMVVTLDDGSRENFARIVWDAVEVWRSLLGIEEEQD